MATSLELAITAIRSNRKDEGRQLLNLLIQENPNNEMAWLWMSSVVNTDEQRARCLYHVLAINPDNQVAQRGLQLLGIVVSDSRPVKVPRDSQPIKIPKPSPPNTQFMPSDTQPLEPKPQPVPAEERRPFRLDPQAIVDELPFKPITKPFSETSSPTETPPQAATPSQPVPVVQANTTPPSEPVPAIQSETNTPSLNPSQPMPIVPTNATQPQPPGTGPLSPGVVQQPPSNTGALQNPVTQQPVAAQPGTQYYPLQPAQQFPVGTMPPQDTRPSQPVPIVPSNVTMGMPPQYIQTQDQSQPVSPIHSNHTMGMPAPVQPIPPNGQMPYPSEPVSVVHANTTMGMPAYGQPQQPLLQNQGVNHSNSTMMMPAGAAPMPAPQAGMVDYRVANAMGMMPNTPGANRPQTKGDEGEEEINVLAVVIFGSLSVTALGGLGMLILLMFAT